MRLVDELQFGYFILRSYIYQLLEYKIEDILELFGL